MGRVSGGPTVELGRPMGQNDQVPFLLLIEDDDAIRTALELSLSRQGHRVATAATGEDGLNLLREQRPDWSCWM